MQLTKIKRIVLVGHENVGSASLLKMITAAYPDIEFLLVVGKGLYYKKSFLGSVIKLLREASLLFTMIRFIELMRFKLKRDTMQKYARRNQITVIHTSDINSQESKNYIRKFAPDLLVSVYHANL